MSAATPGVCRFCGVTDAHVDGDKLSWLSSERTCCSKYECRRKDADESKRRKAAAPRLKRRTPADIHALILEERAAKRARYRAAAKARGLLRSKGGDQ